MANLDETTITICEDTTFTLDANLTDSAGNAITLATNTTAEGSIRSDFSGGAATYATFNGGLVDASAGLVSWNLTADQATAYVATATFPDDDTRTVEHGIYDVEIIENTGALAIVAVSTSAESFTVSGDFSRLGKGGSTAVVAGSTGNDGSYICIGATYDSGADETTIIMAEDVTDATADGTLTLERETRLAQGTARASREVNS